MMLISFLCVIVPFVFVDKSSAINIPQAETDLAAGGRRVCQYCPYCVNQTVCDGGCTYPECALCKYRFHCNTTCIDDVCRPMPCSALSCGTSQTCYEISPGRGECRCNKGSTCSEDRFCTDLANSGECDFYTCFENRRNCGTNGYMLGYGGKYCNKFGQHFNKFNEAGRNWIVCARKCLTKALIGSYQTSAPAGYRCDNITDYAFHTHVDCYVNCGFCHIWSTNKLALLSVYDLSDFLARRAITQVLEVAKKCVFDVLIG